MKEPLLIGITLGLRVAGTGLFSGAVVGWAAVFFADGMEARAVFGGRGFLAMALLFPTTLFVFARPQNPLGATLTDTSSRLLAHAVASALGVAFGAVLYLVGALTVLTTFGGENGEQLVPVLHRCLPWSHVWIVAGVTLVAGAPLVLRKTEINQSAG